MMKSHVLRMCSAYVAEEMRCLLTFYENALTNFPAYAGAKSSAHLLCKCAELCNYAELFCKYAELGPVLK